MCTRLRQGSMSVQHTASCHRSASPFILPCIFEFSTSKLLKIIVRYTTLHRRSSRVYIIYHIYDGPTLQNQTMQIASKRFPSRSCLWEVLSTQSMSRYLYRTGQSISVACLRGRSFPGGIYASRTPIRDHKCDAKSYRLSQVIGLELPSSLRSNLKERCITAYNAKGSVSENLCVGNPY